MNKLNCLKGLFGTQTQLFTYTVRLKFLSSEYSFSHNNRPRRLFDFEALLFGPFWRVAIKFLFQSKSKYFHEISWLCNFFFPSNNK